MKNINIKNTELQLYKRENSKIWQIKFKLPLKKAKRISSGTRILSEAKKIAIKKFKSLSLENLFF